MTKQLEPLESYWIATTDTTAYPQLSGDIEVDIAVVGGGIAGLCTAWELSRAGRSVAVIEAGRIAGGVTGHTTAKLSAQHGLIYDHLRETFGAASARDYATAQTEAIEHVATTAGHLGVDCDLERAPAFVYTESEDRVPTLRAEAEAAREAGLDASFTTDTGLPFPVAGAVRVENQAQFHPRKYLLAIAADLTARGASIYERSRVVELDSDHAVHTLTAESGATVSAREVVVATHFPIFNRLKLFPRLTPRRELVVAAPIPAEADPGGMYLTPEDHTRSVRTAPYGDERRLLIVTGEAFTPGSPDVSGRLDRLTEWTAERFGATDPAYRWAAQDNATTDKVPFVGRFKGRERLYVACGFGGWGMSNGVAAARLIAALSRDEPPQWSELFDPGRLHAVKEASRLAANQTSVVKHLVGDRITRHPAESPEDLGPGEGAIMRVDGSLHAVSRDEDGTVHTLAATCTHMGCVVGYNDAERSWDCPCHGSRFDQEGAILHGPATEPLPKRELKES